MNLYVKADAFGRVYVYCARHGRIDIPVADFYKPPTVADIGAVEQDHLLAHLEPAPTVRSASS